MRAACARHLLDLEQGAGRGLRWDTDAVARVLAYFREVLCLNGGQFEGQPFYPDGWQCFVLGSLFGWKGPDGFRRFRVAYIETGKGSGKSPLVAGIGHYGLTADNEPRAEIYAAATKKDQAMVLFRDAVAMWQLSPELTARLTASGTGEKIWNLAYLEQGAFFRPISADDGQSGPRPHIGLIDEVHEHKSNIVVEMLRAGTKSRRQAMIVMITNSGTSRHSVCWEYHQYAVNVASGMIEDDAFFGYVCALDDHEDPLTDESCWPKVNPSLDVGIPGIKYLREQVTQARGMPSKEAVVRRLNFCQWVESNNPWIGADTWLGASRQYEWRAFRGRRVVGGLDLSSTRDLTALVLWIEPAEVGEPWRLVPFFWMPEEGLSAKADADRVPYTVWRDQGWIETTPGAAVSRTAVCRRIAEIVSMASTVRLAYDRWRIADLREAAAEAGICLPELIEFGQGFQSMSPAVEEFERRLLGGEVVHNGNPCMTWCAANTVLSEDDAGNRKPSKAKSTGRIDGIVAAVMGAGQLMSPKPTKSVYETRGLRTL
ncbi:phage terminase large subunit-like protein [Plasticicumulans acidivorans]|uniref:Phage terminase large subunit-like protein n=1 Tax=Plasticicumulans acidivorans TaxID=886464 RepID=A0A317N0B4_9GAMM|nr:phage terminase large subunit-like protein [Plasticicumulans acidivorans]